MLRPALLRQHLRKETQMLNLIKSQPEPDFGSFIAHPLANMFPMIEGNAFEELKRDIAAQGILEPIRLYQGMILDGRNRYAAAKACGHTFTVDDFVQWEGTLAEAEAWVISTNMHRRQLTTKQKQEVIEGCCASTRRSPTERSHAKLACPTPLSAQHATALSTPLRSGATRTSSVNGRSFPTLSA